MLERAFRLTKLFRTRYDGSVKLLTTDDVAKLFGVSSRRVRMLIQAGRLPAVRVGRDWLVDRKDVALVRHRSPGRPSKRRSGRR